MMIARKWLVALVLGSSALVSSAFQHNSSQLTAGEKAFFDAVQKEVSSVPINRRFGLTRMMIEVPHQKSQLKPEYRKVVEQIDPKRDITLASYGRHMNQFRVSSRYIYRMALHATPTKPSVTPMAGFMGSDSLSRAEALLKGPDDAVTYTIKGATGSVRVAMKRFPATDASCIKCHEGAKVGQPMGVIAIFEAERRK